MPIFFLGAVSTIFFAVLADRNRSRWLFIIIPFSIAMVGFLGLLCIPHPRLPGLTYAFLFCLPAGLYPAVIGCVTWVGNNLAPSWKRAIGIATLMTWGSLGGAVGSNIFLQRQAPRYQLGYGFSFGILIAGMLATVVLRFCLNSINKKRDAMSEEQIRAEYTDGKFLSCYDHVTAELMLTSLSYRATRGNGRQVALVSLRGLRHTQRGPKVRNMTSFLAHGLFIGWTH